MTRELLYKVTDGVGFITLNRPEQGNALTREMLTGLHECFSNACDDKEVRVVCLSGSGKKAFCAGGDLGSVVSGAENPSGPRLYADLLKLMPAFPKPIVAKVGAPCLAGGLGLMLACDIVLAKQGVFFQAPEVNVGLFPYMVGALLHHDVSWKRAMDLVLTARRVSGEEALAMGLVSRLIDESAFESEVEQVLTDLAAKSPIGMRLGKEAFFAMRDTAGYAKALDLLCGALGKAVQTEDAREGMAAFMEKRKPVFKGR